MKQIPKTGQIGHKHTSGGTTVRIPVERNMAAVKRTGSKGSMKSNDVRMH